MPIYDYECGDCGFVFEHICNMQYKPTIIKCRMCHADSRPIITASGVYTGNDDADWIKSVRDVVGNETREGREFKRNPSRTNYKAWMKKKGLRPLENNERLKPDAPDLEPHHHEVARRHMKRNRIEVS